MLDWFKVFVWALIAATPGCLFWGWCSEAQAGGEIRWLRVAVVAACVLTPSALAAVGGAALNDWALANREFGRAPRVPLVVFLAALAGVFGPIAVLVIVAAVWNLLCRGFPSGWRESSPSNPTPQRLTA